MQSSYVVLKVIYEMTKNAVSFILSFMILMKNINFRVLSCGVLDRTV
jgi:hypothetical protein